MRTFITFCFTAAVLWGQIFTATQPGVEYRILSEPNRDPWQKPDQVISALKFSSSETVAVIENGYPYFATRIAPHAGKVYAINADPRAFQGPKAPPPGVGDILSTWTDPRLSSINADTVMIVDMLRFLPSRLPYYLGIIAGLKAGGRLVIIDRPLPSAFAPGAGKLDDVFLKAELPLAGFRFAQQFTILQPYQYFLVFQR
ncbi:MAG TPA: hypothetical protein VHB50_19915 [Bryobacteraceae bacterium]|nr:hypothetical protein [Bryobacteraceae bacterium]